jgi:hypothetical protein
MATPITGALGRHWSTQDVTAGIGLTPRTPQAVAVGTGSWPSSASRDARLLRIPRRHQQGPEGPIRRGEHTHDT